MLDCEVCVGAIELGRLLHSLAPGDAEAAELLARLLLTDSRRDTRVDEYGDLLLLSEQDRARWDQAQIAEGMTLSRWLLPAPHRDALRCVRASLAVAMASWPGAGLGELDEVTSDSALQGYHYVPAARADLLQRRLSEVTQLGGGWN